MIIKEQKTEEQKAAIEVKDFRAFNPGKGPLRGFAVVRIGSVVVKDVQLLEYKQGHFSVAMPSFSCCSFSRSLLHSSNSIRYFLPSLKSLIPHPPPVTTLFLLLNNYYSRRLV